MTSRVHPLSGRLQEHVGRAAGFADLLATAACGVLGRPVPVRLLCAAGGGLEPAQGHQLCPCVLGISPTSLILAAC